MLLMMMTVIILMLLLMLLLMAIAGQNFERWSDTDVNDWIVVARPLVDRLLV
jgi:hypothetical protein